MKTVLITGASGGLGQMVSRLCFEKGFHVIGVSTGKRLEAHARLVKDAKRCNVTYRSVSIDLADPTSLRERLVADHILPHPKNVLHLVLCHGVNVVFPFHEVGWDTIDVSMRINFGSSFILTQYMVNNWVEGVDAKTTKRKDRCVVYVGSVAVKGASPDELSYHAAKNAMVSAMRSFVRKYTPYGIRFNIISPGLMDTEMGRETVKKRPDVLERIPLGRLVRVEEVARGILYFIESVSITGVDLDVNAGRYVSL